MPALMENFVSAPNAAAVYPTDGWHCNLLLTITMEALAIPRDEAKALLHTVMKVSKNRAPEDLQKFLKRSVSYFFSIIAKTAVCVFLKTMFDRDNIGIKETLAPGSPRCHFKLPLDVATRLGAGAGSDFLADQAAYDATLEATAAVVQRVGGDPACFFERPTTAGGRPVVVCLLAHLALVATKIHAYLQREAKMAAGGLSGINPGHRVKWVQMLGVLNVHIVAQGSETLNGLRLLDGANRSRAIVPADSIGAEADSGTDDGDGGSGGWSAGDEEAEGEDAGGAEGWDEGESETDEEEDDEDEEELLQSDGGGDAETASNQ